MTSQPGTSYDPQPVPSKTINYSLGSLERKPLQTLLPLVLKSPYSPVTVWKLWSLKLMADNQILCDPAIQPHSLWEAWAALRVSFPLPVFPFGSPGHSLAFATWEVLACLEPSADDGFSICILEKAPFLAMVSSHSVSLSWFLPPEYRQGRWPSSIQTPCRPSPNLSQPVCSPSLSRLHPGTKLVLLNMA